MVTVTRAYGIYGQKSPLTVFERWVRQIWIVAFINSSGALTEIVGFLADPFILAYCALRNNGSGIFQFMGTRVQLQADAWYAIVVSTGITTSSLSKSAVLNHVSRKDEKNKQLYRSMLTITNLKLLGLRALRLTFLSTWDKGRYAVQSSIEPIQRKRI
jgi:hypothetical protein